jgi:hypothetical protein
MSLYAALDDSRYINEHWQDNAEQLYEKVAFRNVIGADRRLQTSGVAFARKAHMTTMRAKDAARWRIIDSLSREEWPNKLRVLTLPGLEWLFERELINSRDYAIHGDGWKASPQGAQFFRKDTATEIVALEYDPAVYFGSIKWMPAAKKKLTQLSPHALSTSKIEVYYFTDAETFIGDTACPHVDAAWLDFTGYMTPARLYRINRFWKEKCGHQLAITVLNARYPSHVKAHVLKHGSMEKWISSVLGGNVYDIHHYFDDHSAMLQIIVRR